MSELDDRLRGSAKVFVDPSSPRPTGRPVPERLGEVRHRSAARRRVRRRAVSGLATALVILAVAAVLRLPGGIGGRQVGTGGDGTPTTEAETTGPGTTAPEVVPGTVIDATPQPATATTPVPTTTAATPAAPAPPVPGAVPASTAPEAPAPRTGPLRFATDGLGVARFGDDVPTAMTALTASLGPPDNPGSPTTNGRCGIISSQYVLWGNLAVTFHDRGGGLRFASYQYGDPTSRQSSGGHPAPVGPGRPVVDNPWSLRLGGAVSSADALLGEVRSTYPAAEVGTPQGWIDTILTFPLAGTFRANIELHPAPGGGFLFERFTVWSMPDITC